MAAKPKAVEIPQHKEMALKPGKNIEQGLKRLKSLAVTIKKELINADALAVQATEKYMAVGLHLLEARSLFPGDLEFGRWRQETIPDMKTNWAGRLMQIASDDRIMGPDQKLLTGVADMGISVLAELVSAPDDVLEKVIDKTVKSGKAPTVSDVRAEKKTAKEDKEADKTTPVTVTPDGKKVDSGIGRNKPENKKRLSLEEQAQEAIDKPFLDRLMAYRPDIDAIIPSDPLIVFGMISQFTDVSPNMNDLQDWYTFLLVNYDGQMNEGDKLKLGECLDAALELCKEMRGK